MGRSGSAGRWQPIPGAGEGLCQWTGRGAAAREGTGRPHRRQGPFRPKFRATRKLSRVPLASKGAPRRGRAGTYLCGSRTKAAKTNPNLEPLAIIMIRRNCPMAMSKSSFTALIRSQCQAPHSFENSCVWTEFRKESFLDPENGILNTKPQRGCPVLRGSTLRTASLLISLR